MAIGTILAWTASAQEILPDEGFSFTVTKDDASIYGPAFGVGAILGALPAGLVSGRIGSRRAMALYEVLVVVGWVLLIFPRSVWVLVVGRIFQGVGVGALCSIIPVYVAEISQPNIRGTVERCAHERCTTGGGGEGVWELLCVFSPRNFQLMFSSAPAFFISIFN